MKITRNIELYNLFSFFYALDFYLPIKVVYFHQVTGSYATAASIISFVWIAQSLLEIPTGIFSDIVGRKKTIVIGSFCSVLAYALYAIGTHYWIFLFGSLLEGARRSLFSGNNNAYLHNLLSNENKENEYHQHYGKLSSLMGIAMFIAALGSGFLAAWSISTFMWINIVPQIIAFIVSLLLFNLRIEKVTNTNIYAHLKQAVSEIKSNVHLRDLSFSEILGGGGLCRI